MTDKEKDKCLDDLILWGQAITKTEIEDGKPTVKYIDPGSDEARVAMYNAEHTDSFMKIEYQPVSEHAYDGSKLYHIGYDPFMEFNPKDVDFSIYKGTELIKRNITIMRFRLPRKLKKKVKQMWKEKLSRANLYFAHQTYILSKL